MEHIGAESEGGSLLKVLSGANGDIMTQAGEVHRLIRVQRVIQARIHTLILRKGSKCAALGKREGPPGGAQHQDAPELHLHPLRLHSLGDSRYFLNM